MKTIRLLSTFAAFMFSAGSLAQDATDSLPNAPSFELSQPPSSSSGPPEFSPQSQLQPEKKEQGELPANASPDANRQLQPSTHTPLAPLTMDDKCTAYLHGAFGPRAVLLSAIISGIKMANPPNHYPRDWRQGAGAYGRLYGTTLAQEASAYTGRFITGALLREDFRYRPSNSKNPGVRTFHALRYTLFDKSDSGHTRIALSNLVGAAAGGFVGNAYLPSGFANVNHAGSRSAVEFGGYALNNLMVEFGPDFMKTLAKLHPRRSKRKTNQRNIQIPDWWVSKKDHS